MPDQIPETVKGTRSERLIALGEKNRSLFEAQHAGGEVTVLFEERTELDGAEYFTGYTKEYIKAAIPADEDYENVQVHGRLGKELAPHLFLLEK